MLVFVLIINKINIKDNAFLSDENLYNHLSLSGKSLWTDVENGGIP